MGWKKFTHVPKYVCIVMEIQYIRVAVIPSDGKGNCPKVLKNVHLCLHTGGFCDILILVAGKCSVAKTADYRILAEMKSAISRETDAERMALAVSRLSVAGEHFASEHPG